MVSHKVWVSYCYRFSKAEGRTSLWADSAPPACLGLRQVSTHAVYVSLTYLLSLTKFSSPKIFIFTFGVNFVPFYHFKFANVVPHTSVKKKFRNPLLKMVKKAVLILKVIFDQPSKSVAVYY